MQAVVSVLLEGRTMCAGEVKVRWLIQQYPELVRKISRPKPCTSTQSILPSLPVLDQSLWQTQGTFTQGFRFLMYEDRQAGSGYFAEYCVSFLSTEKHCLGAHGLVFPRAWEHTALCSPGPPFSEENAKQAV